MGFDLHSKTGDAEFSTNSWGFDQIRRMLYAAGVRVGGEDYWNALPHLSPQTNIGFDSVISPDQALDFARKLSAWIETASDSDLVNAGVEARAYGGGLAMAREHAKEFVEFNLAAAKLGGYTIY